ncbi:MAG: Hsp70 family protein [Planctomycetaceae bacterium]
MTENTDGPIVGIDLGTTNSVVSAIVNGKAQVLDEDGEKLLPSVVGLKPDGTLVTGTVARNQLAAFPDRTIASIKRKMGTMEPVMLGDQSFTPPEISAMILRRLRDRAARALGEPVTRAVITVPAFFDENQRQATREAGELAGLKVERIINEPTAATLVYHAGSQERQHIVVYDFGGGTFDVSVVRMEAGVVEVLSSKGDTKLGGDDLDALLMDHVARLFEKEHGIDLRTEVSSRYRLLQACELAKQKLSSEETVEIVEEFIAEKNGSPLNLKVSVSRDDYEHMIVPLVDRTIACVDDALRDVMMTADQIDDLVLVGGSTRTPLVERRLREEFRREPSRAVDPDLAVALGAGTQAAMLAGRSVGPVLVDVTGHTLGIEAVSEMTFAGPKLVFSPIIRRNSALPARYEECYSKMHDDQERVSIRIFQGEHSDLNRNREIGDLDLDLESGGGDRNKIVVRFDLTLDGTLKVTVTQPATGKSRDMIIDNALSQFQADDRDRAKSRLGAMFDASDEILDDADLPSKAEWAENASENTSTQQFPQAAAMLQRIDNLSHELPAEDADEISTLRERLKRAMADGSEIDVVSVCEELDDILFYVQ